MDKVKLPKEVAEAIDGLRDEGCENQQILELIYKTDMSAFAIRLTGFVMIHGFDTLLQALVNGYEVYETPEDKVREYAELLRVQHINATAGRNDTSSPYGDELRGCMKTLDKLGIQIEGVNT